MSYGGSQFQQFSNPNRFFCNAPTGIREGHVDAEGYPDAADNTLTLNRASPYVAAMRTPQVTLLESPRLSRDGARFEFRISGSESGLCTIEHTMDLRVWTLLRHCQLDGEGVELADAVAGQAARFYRVSTPAGAVSTRIGFIKKTVPTGLSMIANQLDGLDNTVAELFPAAPDGTQIYWWIEGLQKWECVAFNLGEWDNPALTLHPGEGALIRNPGEPFDVFFVGEVPQAHHNRVPTQRAVRSFSLPQAGLLSSELGYVPFGAGGQVYRMAGGRYKTFLWDGDAWSPEEPTLELGEAFWCVNPIELGFLAASARREAVTAR